MVFFDLPVVSAAQRRVYAKFRKFLISSGFIMLQESVYCKICLNNSGVESIKAALKKNLPRKGLVQLLVITERQFARMEYLVGEKKSEFLDTDERLVII